MVTKKEFIDFAEFCQNNFNLEIHRHIIEDYINFKNQSENKFSSKNEEQKMKCDLNGVGCCYVAFNSVKCNECLN